MSAGRPLANSAPEFAVEKGIPAPTNLRGKYPFATMEVGDSFLIPGAETSAEVSSSITYRKNRHGEQYVCRKVEGGMRVWRIG